MKIIKYFWQKIQTVNSKYYRNSSEIIKIEIPGFGRLELEQVALDYNGTLTLVSELLEGIKKHLFKLAQVAQFLIAIADTF